MKKSTGRGRCPLNLLTETQAPAKIGQVTSGSPLCAFILFRFLIFIYNATPTLAGPGGSSARRHHRQHQRRENPDSHLAVQVQVFRAKPVITAPQN